MDIAVAVDSQNDQFSNVQRYGYVDLVIPTSCWVAVLSGNRANASDAEENAEMALRVANSTDLSVDLGIFWNMMKILRILKLKFEQNAQ